MPTDTSAPLREPVGDAPDEIRALFDYCVLLQQLATPAKFEAVRARAIQDLSFLPPSAPKLDSQGEVLIWRGLLYGKLLSLLNSAQNDEQFWYRLALWIKSEGIREPEQFLPKDVYKRLTKEATRRLKASRLFGTGDFNTYLVRIWLRYTEPLLRKAKWLRQRKPPCNVKRELERNGFDLKILAVLEGKTKKNWTSAVEFTCAWVAQRGGAPDAETLRNAYSRAYGRRMLSKISCSFCEKPAENEFWVRGDPIPHCREHGADRLPTTEISARTDRFGRRWWREDLEIRHTTLVA